MADVEKYLDLITAFHRGKPKFSAMVDAVSRCFVGAQDSYGRMVPAYDLDDAVGVQLDAVGEWVGISRNVRTPLEGVYFSLDSAGLGFEQGVWQGPFDPDTGITSLDDETYRVLIRAKIGANHWDGTLESSAAILNSIFSAGTSPIPVNANAEPFGTGDGATTQFQLKYEGRPIFQVGSATLFRNDWQGNQRLYPTPRTNLLRQSTDLTLSPWTGGPYAAFASPLITPRGDASAWAVIPAAGTNLVSGGRTNVCPKPSAAPMRITYSVIAKQAGFNNARLWLNGANTSTATAFTNFSLVDGSITQTSIGTDFSDLQYGAVALGDGWWLLYIQVTTDAAANVVARLYTFQAGETVGDGVRGIAFWLPQVEVSDVATSRIETAASTVTVTDYAASSTGLITMGQVPAVGAALTWTGDGEIYPSGTYVFIQDNGDMSIDIGIAGDRPTAVFLALLTGGYIPIKPEGVRVNYFIVPDVDGPLFGFDVRNQYISGFDVGAWGDLYAS